MKRVKIEVEETISYRDKIIVHQPDDMTDEEFDALFKQVEHETKRLDGGAKDLAYSFTLKGITVESQTYNFPSSPENSSLEVIDVEDLGEIK